MTDDAINRLVAERVMGWSIYHYDKDVAANCYYMLTDADGDPVAAFDGWHTGERKTEAEAWADAPDYCTDPTAWGALFEHLAPRHTQVRLGHGVRGWVAMIVGSGKGDISAVDADSPGRALALAALRAYGVTIE